MVVIDLASFCAGHPGPGPRGRAARRLANRRLHELARTLWRYRRVPGLRPADFVYDGERWTLRRAVARATACRTRKDPDVFSAPAMARWLPARLRASLREAIVNERRERWPERWDRHSMKQVFRRVMRRPAAHPPIGTMLTTVLPADVRRELREMLPGLAGPECFGDLLPFVRSLKAAIRASPSRVVLRSGGRSIVIGTTPIGRGNAGLVFGTSDGREVLKLPRSNWWAIASLLDEAPSERVWRRRARRRFTVPRTRLASRAGLFACRDRLRDESLADFLLARRLCRYDAATRRYTLSPSLATDPDVPVIWAGVHAMIAAIRRSPRYALSLAPGNVFVQYGRGTGGRRRVARIGLVDVGPVDKAADSYGAMTDRQAYFEYCAGRLTKYGRRGWIRPARG